MEQIPGVKTMHNPAYNIQSYPPPMTNKTPDSPVYMERTYSDDGRGNQLCPPPYMTPRYMNTSTSPSTEALSPKTIKSLVMCLCVGVMVCGVLVLLSLSLTIYALSGRMGDLESTNRQLAEQLQEQSDQLGTVLAGNTSTKIIQELNASVTELRSKVNLSVSPFSNCSQERTTCSIGAMGGTLADGYHFQCYPPQQDMYKEGFYTVDVRCEYSSNNGYFASAHLQYAGSTVFCFCDLIYPNFNTGLLQVLPQQTTFTCHLVIDRCPIS